LQRVSFYFSAHEDDWQLFMNPSAFRDVRDGVKTVFIHVTAGDGGLGTGNGGRRHPYYLAREQGAQSAIRFMADAGEYPAPAEPTLAAMAVNGHAIRRVSYRDTVSYFMRLPDGSPDGGGYAETGHQSLQRLAGGEIATLTAIEGTTAYQGWPDLVATVRAMIDFERGPATTADLHHPELDPALNPNDHPDHVMTGKLALEAVTELSGMRLVHHLGYASGERPENLGGYERDMKCAVYAVTLAAIQALDHSTNWSHYDQSFVARDYWRTDDGSA
jgi:LmbE family N-acetylglucosaminyl deacetylase